MLFKYLNIIQFIFLLSFSFKPSLNCYASETNQSGEKVYNRYYSDNLLLLNIDYFSDAQYAGFSGISSVQPIVASGISFYSKKNIDLAVQTLCAWNSDTSFTKIAYEYDFTAGYSFNLSTKFSIRPAFSYSLYSPNSNTLLTAYSGIIQTDLYYITDHYISGNSLNYVFGKKNMFSLTIQQVVYHNFDNIFGKNSFLSLQLEADLIFNDKNYYHSFIYDSWNAEELIYWIDDNYPDHSQFIAENIIQYGLDVTKERLLTNNIIDSKKLYDPIYSITSVQLLTPITLSISRYAITLTPILSIPCYQSDFYDQYTNFILNIGIMVSFNP